LIYLPNSKRSSNSWWHLAGSRPRKRHLTEGLRLLVSSERLRQQVQEGIEQADRGELVDHDTVFGQLRAMAAATQAARKQ
jgi:predicted transcriptional regulator